MMPETIVRPSDIQDEVASYTMPEVSNGLAVVWYPQGVENRSGQLAFVSQAYDGRNNVTLFIAGHRNPLVEAVPHISDPRLQLGPDVRESGAWDYTAEYKAENQWRAELDERLTSIEKKISMVEKKIPKPTPKS